MQATSLLQIVALNLIVFQESKVERDFCAFFKKIVAKTDLFVVYSKIACKRLGDVVILWK